MKIKASANQISESRKLLENQYAHIDSDGGYSAIVENKSKIINVDNIRSPELLGKRVSEIEIENIAKTLRRTIWDQQENPELIKIDRVMDALNPIKALKNLGYEVSFVSDLGRFETDQGQTQTAGYINSSGMVVGLSSQFPKHIQNFTAAHELGHAVLHDSAAGIHRDRALDGRKIANRDPKEFEADKFASAFLMPGKLVRKEFSKRFQTKKFVLNDESVFLLTGGFVVDIRAMKEDKRIISRLLAESNRYQSSFVSMKQMFNVSTEAMAIRLEELELL